MSAAEEQRPEIKIKLSVVKGPHLGRVFQLSTPSFTIGRGPENDVVLMNDPLISRTHAQVTIVDRDLEISNLSAKNAIFVQGESVQKWKIVNNTNFTVGESEICVEYDLGKPVASVPIKKSAEIVQFKPKDKSKDKPIDKTAPPRKAALPADKNAATAMRRPQQVMNRPFLAASVQNRVGTPGPSPQNQSLNSRGLNSSASPSLLGSPRFKIYLILAIVLGGGLLLFFGTQ